MKNLNYEQAEQLLESGKKVKLPEWSGFWFKDKVSGRILVLTKEGEILSTPHEEYKIRNDWEIAKSNPAQNKIIKNFYDSKSTESESNTVSDESNKIWTRNANEIVIIEDRRDSILVVGNDGVLSGGVEFYGIPVN